MLLLLLLLQQPLTPFATVLLMRLPLKWISKRKTFAFCVLEMLKIFPLIDRMSWACIYFHLSVSFFIFLIRLCIVWLMLFRNEIEILIIRQSLQRQMECQETKKRNTKATMNDKSNDKCHSTSSSVTAAVAILRTSNQRNCKFESFNTPTHFHFDGMPLWRFRWNRETENTKSECEKTFEKCCAV